MLPYVRFAAQLAHGRNAWRDARRGASPEGAVSVRPLLTHDLDVGGARRIL